MKKPFKRVHFEFKTHSPGERFSTQKTPRPEVKTIVFEYGPGYTAKPWTLEELKTLKKGTLVLDSRRAFLEKAVRAGKRVVAGEAFREQQDKDVLEALDNNYHVSWKSFLADPNFANSKKYFVAFAVKEYFREKLIKKTILEEQKHGEVEAYYGTAHSYLSGELRKMGIESSRYIKPQQFDWRSTVLRKILRKLRPKMSLDKGRLTVEINKEAIDSIPEIEYKKAHITALFFNNPKIVANIAGTKQARITSDDYILVALLGRALLNKMPESQIDQYLKTGKTDVLFSGTGLPSPEHRVIGRKSLVGFLDKHSLFWKRMQKAKKMQKK